jgi:hypothetical protein
MRCDLPGIRWATDAALVVQGGEDGEGMRGTGEQVCRKGGRRDPRAAATESFLDTYTVR